MRVGRDIPGVCWPWRWRQEITCMHSIYSISRAKPHTHCPTLFKLFLPLTSEAEGEQLLCCDHDKQKLFVSNSVLVNIYMTRTKFEKMNEFLGFHIPLLVHLWNLLELCNVVLSTNFYWYFDKNEKIRIKFKLQKITVNSISQYFPELHQF